MLPDVSREHQVFSAAQQIKPGWKDRYSSIPVLFFQRDSTWHDLIFFPNSQDRQQRLIPSVQLTLPGVGQPVVG
jgi:hypothetical protein